MHKHTLRNIFVLAALLCAGVAHAQNVGVDPVQYSVVPETPGPNSPVQISMSGVGPFLGDATVVWSVNGKPVESGVGLSSFSLTTGAIGTQTVVGVTIVSSTQGTITHTFVFTPSTVDLMWESDTSVPPLYRGHALYSAGAPLTVVAFPTVVAKGKRVAAGSLSYQWTVNDTPLPQSSGTGKYVLSFNGDQLQSSEHVAVDVYLGSLKVGHADLVVPAATPQLVLYYKDPLRGVVWDEALGSSIALTGSEISVQAQPYYFSHTGGA